MAEGKHAVEFGVLLGSGTIRCVRKAQYISAVVTVIIVIATTITIIISCCAFGSPRRLVVCLFVHQMAKWASSCVYIKGWCALRS